MIELNTKLETKVEIDLGIKGTEKTPKLRMLFYTPTFFIGFDGNHRLINIPILDHISWPDTQVTHAKLEILLDEYNVVLWEDDIQLVSEEIKEEMEIKPVNKIKVEVKFEEEDIKGKPGVKVSPKF